jgi:hypothetical protein
VSSYSLSLISGFRGENKEAVEICMLKTMEPEDEVIGLTTGQDVDWLQATLMKSDWLQDALSDLDSTCESVTFHVSPNDQFFRLSANGETGEWNVCYFLNIKLI